MQFILWQLVLATNVGKYFVSSICKYCNFCTNCTDYLGLFNNNTNIEIKRLLKSTTISDFGSKCIYFILFGSYQFSNSWATESIFNKMLIGF